MKSEPFLFISSWTLFSLIKSFNNDINFLSTMNETKLEPIGYNFDRFWLRFSIWNTWWSLYWDDSLLQISSSSFWFKNTESNSLFNLFLLLLQDQDVISLWMRVSTMNLVALRSFPFFYSFWRYNLGGFPESLQLSLPWTQNSILDYSSRRGPG